jgi:hypothetical protein
MFEVMLSEASAGGRGFEICTGHSFVGGGAGAGVETGTGLVSTLPGRGFELVQPAMKAITQTPTRPEIISRFKLEIIAAICKR